MRLLIKGCSATAKMAASERGIELSRIKISEFRNETFATVSKEDLLKVVHWYCESHNGAPFHDGTLLFYSEKASV